MLKAEHDWRYSWVHRTLVALDQGIEALKNELADGFNMLEYGDGIAGVAFVTVQTYVSGTCGDLTKLFGVCPKQHGIVRDSASVVIPSAGINAVRAIWGVANYHKHREDGTKIRSDTVDVLQKLGLENAEFPCIKALELLQKDCKTTGLLDAAKPWRETWIAKFKAGHALA